jgi:pentose-5-phosphate-3-epimerase
MSYIVPTITAYDAHQYREQMELVSAFSEFIHIDYMEKSFAGVDSVAFDQIWWNDGIKADIHIMADDPMAHIDQILLLKPYQVTVHAERHSLVDLTRMASILVQNGICPALAFLQDTQLSGHEYLIPHFTDILIFSGHLGHHGGTADLSLLQKAAEIKAYHKWVQLGWDGGINSENIADLINAKIEILNTGSAIHRSADPAKSFEQLQKLCATI